MKKKNNFVIGALMVIIAIIIFGYASIIKEAEKNKVSVKGKEHWRIDIISVTKDKHLSNPEVVENKKPTIHGTSIDFDVSIPDHNSQIVYDIIIENKGTLTAKFNSISNIEAINNSNPKNITYSIEKVSDNKSDTISRLEKDYFRLIISSSSETGKGYSKPATIYFDYEQA